jgi:hypothetical protein
MARKKNSEESASKTVKKKPKSNPTRPLSHVEWPKVTVGSHSTRTEYEDGRVEFVTDWEALKRDVKQAIEEFENGKKIN